MASVINDPNGRRRLQFTDPNGRRQTIRLGKMPKRTAESVKTYVEHLLVAQLSKRPVDGDTAKWVASLDDVLSERLAKAGLIRGRESALLGDFMAGYIKSRHDVKPATATVYSHTQRNLLAYFGGDKPLRDITPGDADQWRLYLLAEGLSENTVRRRCGIAKQFFTAAVRQRLIPVNPFEGLKAAIITNRSRDYFVSRDEAQKVIEACPDAQWRLLFALSRYGGLRCPSEHLVLQWGDVDWAGNKVTIRSPKTEHHEGGESRVVPLFPELRPYLEESFDLAKPGTKYAITRYRDSNANLRSQLVKIIRRAGLTPWPKLFHNLRASRQTELAEDYPAHVVCCWIGNSRIVAEKHYLQVTDDHFQKAAQNATQPVHESGCQPMTAKQKTPQLSGNNVSDNAGQLLNMCLVGDTGLEPVTPSLSS